jgi:type II secretory ATPase GspE/PulE/Tfp pilus assembly ATPase PilB-like protein
VAAGYVVSCWNCLGEFEATGAVWCSDDPKNPTKLCPFCLHCFCEASAEYKQEFWRKAPPQLVEELQTLGKSQDRLGDVLIRMKKIQTPQLLDALVEQRETGRKLGEILIARKLVTREDVDSALRSQGVTRLSDTRSGEATPPYWQQSTPDGVLDYLLALGARKRASDVSLAPEPDQIAVRYRIDGFSFRVEPIPRSFEHVLERALFAMFSLDPARRSRPQSGRCSTRLGEDEYDLLIQTVPGAQGLSATIKLVNRSTFIKDFATLGLELEDRVRLVEEIRSGLGLILVSSPAYDGASTTCYSIMSFLAQGQRDVLSIESPIQWTIDGVRQVEAEAGPAGPRMDLTLRAMAAVRPDVLMLSAIPDHATLLLAAQLASSRLVVARATAATAARALVGLREMGAPPQLLAGSLGLVLGQRLIRTLCRICRVEAEPPPAKTLEAHGIERDEADKLIFYKGKGCPTCNTIGYRGRRAIFEAIPSSPEVRGALERGLGADELHAAAVETGMITIRERALGLVRAGVTSFDEFARLRL